MIEPDRFKGGVPSVRAERHPKAVGRGRRIKVGIEALEARTMLRGGVSALDMAGGLLAEHGPFADRLAIRLTAGVAKSASRPGQPLVGSVARAADPSVLLTPGDSGQVVPASFRLVMRRA